MVTLIVNSISHEFSISYPSGHRESVHHRKHHVFQKMISARDCSREFDGRPDPSYLCPARQTRTIDRLNTVQYTIQMFVIEEIIKRPLSYYDTRSTPMGPHRVFLEMLPVHWLFFVESVCIINKTFAKYNE